MNERQIYSANHIQDLLEDWAHSHPDPLTRQAAQSFLDDQISEDDLEEATLSSAREAVADLLSELSDAAKSLGVDSACSLIKIQDQFIKRRKSEEPEPEPVKGKVIPFKREGDE